MNPFDIGVRCINIARSELLFKIYIMALNRDKYDIEVQNYYAIKRNQILSDFMQQTFNRLYGLYLHEKYLLINTTKEDQLRKQIAA